MEDPTRCPTCGENLCWSFADDGGICICTVLTVWCTNCGYAASHHYSPSESEFLERFEAIAKAKPEWERRQADMFPEEVALLMTVVGGNKVLYQGDPTRRKVE